jgi:hypothetical protein
MRPWYIDGLIFLGGALCGAGIINQIWAGALFRYATSRTPVTVETRRL